MENILRDDFGESWIVVENTILHVFTEKRDAINFRYLLIKTRNEPVKIFHRYTDGSLHLLEVWPKEYNQGLPSIMEYIQTNEDDFSKYFET